MHRIEQKLDATVRELNDMKEKLTAQEEHIEYLSDNLGEVKSKLREAEDKVEDLERRSRRDNIILYGVQESDGETHEDCAKKFVDIANEVLPDRLEVKDIRRAHRLGRPEPEKTRPLIACLQRSADKYAVLGARSQLKAKGIGVSSDRTNKQRRQLQEARAEGFHAYFRGNTLHRSPRQDRDRIQTRSFSRAQGQDNST